MNNLTIKSILFAFLLTMYLGAEAQTFKSDTVRNKTVNVFNSSTLNKDYDKAKSGSTNNDGYRYAVKVNPLLAIYGDLPIYVEYRFADKLSAELGAGITIRNFWLEAIDDSYTNISGKTPNKFGSSFRVSLRFYPSSSDDAIEGYYFAPEFMTRNYYNINSYEFYNGSNYNLVEFEHESRQTDYKIIVGYQEAFESNIMVDYYIGFGVRKTKRGIIDTDTNSATYAQSVILNTRNVIFTLGVKVGFGF